MDVYLYASQLCLVFIPFTFPTSFNGRVEWNWFFLGRFVPSSNSGRPFVSYVSLWQAVNKPGHPWPQSFDSRTPLEPMTYSPVFIPLKWIRSFEYLYFNSVVFYCLFHDADSLCLLGLCCWTTAAALLSLFSVWRYVSRLLFHRSVGSKPLSYNSQFRCQAYLIRHRAISWLVWAIWHEKRRE
jgi:hypothetical protein